MISLSTGLARVLSTLLVGTLLACSSGSDADAASATDGASATDSSSEETTSAADSASGDDAAGPDTAKAVDAPSEVATDTGPSCGKAGQPCCPGSVCDKGLGCGKSSKTCTTCAVNFCVTNGYTNGWYCDGTGTNVQCQVDSSTGCSRAYPEPCPTGVTCSPTTGTCGGCNTSDPCFGQVDGRKLCVAGKGAVTCSKGADGCVTASAPSTCSYMCVAGSGCCGNTGESCCKAVTPSCKTGLTCGSSSTCG